MATTKTTTGHTLRIDPDALTLTIEGDLDTMQDIPDAELDTAAESVGCVIDWRRGPLDATSYAMMEAR